MKIAGSIVLAASALALAVTAAYADTTSSNKDRSTMERRASPSNPTKQDEERAESHGAPDVPHPGGTKGTKQDPFAALDTDGDGAISKAEAAGHAELMKNFERADKNRDGKLSREEYASIGKPDRK